MNRLLSVLLFFCLQAVSASYSEHTAYLAKLVPAVDSNLVQFNQTSLDTEAQAWLKQLDLKLNPQDFAKYKSKLQISFDQSGYINAMTLLRLDDDDLPRFKELVAQLLSIQVAELPKSIKPSTVFDLDTEFMYLDRKTVVQNQETKATSKVIDLLSALGTELELIEPNYIDYPQLGELFVFKASNRHPAKQSFASDVDTKKNGTLRSMSSAKGDNNDLRRKSNDIRLSTMLVDSDQKSMLLKLISIEDANNKQYSDLLLRVARPKSNNKEAFADILGSGLLSALGAGLTSSTLTYGIVPGSLAVAAMTSTAMKLNQEQAFNLSKGARIKTEGLTTIKSKGENNEGSTNIWCSRGSDSWCLSASNHHNVQ